MPDALWESVEPLIPRFAARPQGGGSAPVDDRAVFTTIVYVLTSGCAWRHLPPSFGVTVPTAHRRFTVWAAAGVFERLHREVLDRLGSASELDWTAAILDDASVRAKNGGRWPGRVRSIAASRDKIHVLSDSNGIPLGVDVSGANAHDSTLLQPMVSTIPAVNFRRGPRRRKPGKSSRRQGLTTTSTAGGCAKRASSRALPDAVSTGTTG